MLPSLPECGAMADRSPLWCWMRGRERGSLGIGGGGGGGDASGFGGARHWVWLLGVAGLLLLPVCRELPGWRCCRG